MSGREILGFSSKAALTIAENAAISGAFHFAECEVGHVIVPAAWTAGNIGFQVCDTETGTFVILRDDTGVPVQISTIKTDWARAYALPAKLAGAHWVKLWSKSATAGTETDVSQAAARALTVTKA